MKRDESLMVLAVLFCLSYCIAATPSTQPLKIDSVIDEVHEYRGDLGGNLPIGLSLRLSKDARTAAGCYFYYKYCKDIRIDAEIDGRSILIREFDINGKQTGQFTGEFPKTDPRHHFKTAEDLQTEVITGTWSNPTGSKPEKFYLMEEYRMSWPQGTSRYATAGFNQETTVDEFASRFRQAVLDGKSDEVAAMIQFPINVTIDGKRRTIRDSQEFLTNYDGIFGAKFVDTIRQAPPCHMFCRDEGVMLGDGSVWIAPTHAQGKIAPMVVALNN